MIDKDKMWIKGGKRNNLIIVRLCQKLKVLKLIWDKLERKVFIIYWNEQSMILGLLLFIQFFPCFRVPQGRSEKRGSHKTCTEHFER